MPDRDQGVNAAVASMEEGQAIGERHLAMNAVIFPPMINFPKPKTMSRGFRQVSVEAAILISVPPGLVWLALSSEFHSHSQRKVVLPSGCY